MAIDDNTNITDTDWSQVPRNAQGIPIIRITPAPPPAQTQQPLQIAANDIDTLYDDFSGKGGSGKVISDADINNLYSHFNSTPDTTTQQQPPPEVPFGPAANREQFMRGISDILDTGAHALGNVADFVTKPFPSINAKVQAENEEFNAADTAKRQAFENTYGTEPSAQRVLGQVVGTLPLAPTKLISLWKSAVGAEPAIVAGVKQAAPFVNRLVGSVGEGAIGGATYGAATAGSNDQSTIANVGQGLITGAIAGPLLHAAGEAGANAVPAIKGLWARINVNKVAQSSGIDPNVVKNVFDRLSDAGYTPQEAQAELTRLGPKATLMDLDPSLLAEGSGLAASGGQATSILKNRMENRAAGANSQMVQIMESKLGPKPDLQAADEAILKQAQKETGPDYKAAHQSGVTLDVSGLDAKLAEQSNKSVGPKQQAAKIMRSYLYKTEQDNNGEPISVLRHTVPELHEVRQAIDDVIEKRGTPETSAGKNAMKVLSDTRNAVDSELKSVPEMQAADEKFAEYMRTKEGLQQGYDALTKNTTREDFNKMWTEASPEKRMTIRMGMRAALSDYMDKASRGELEGAKQLLGKKAINRANMRTAFGVRADEALDALEKEASFKNTENKVTQNSLTAERQAVQERYKGRAKEGAGVKDVLMGLIADASTGNPGIGTSIAVAKNTGSKVLKNLAGNKLERLVVGSADVLSQQGKEIQGTLDTVNKIGKIQKKIVPRTTSKYKLPVTSVAPIGQSVYGERKRLSQ